HEQVGYSPKQYIKLLRLSYARELMETTDLPVTDVAVKCGFADVNNFIRAFRQTYSVPPGKWRHSS
ncbi:MAG: helix-turn-helix domain-containing protein, partial [Candidatus Spyradocola sp.]